MPRAYDTSELSDVEERLQPLLSLIADRGPKSGVLVAGARQGVLFFLFGNVVHAATSGGVTGLDAVRAFGALAASGEPVEWQKIPMQPGWTLEGLHIEELITALKEGAATADRVAASEPAPISAETVAQGGMQEAVASIGVPAPSEPPYAAPQPGSAPAYDATEPEEAQPATASTAGSAESAPEPPVVAASRAESHHPEPAPSASSMTEPTGLLGEVVDEDAETSETSPEDAAPTRQLQPLLDPLPASHPALALNPEMSDESKASVDSPPADSDGGDSAESRPRPTVRVPPLLAGQYILEPAPVRSTDVLTFIGDAPRVQLAYEEDRGSRAVALFRGGQFVDALFVGPSEILTGRPAYEMILAAGRGTVALSEIPAEVFEALPACWNGALTVPETSVEGMDLDELNSGLESDRATAVVEIATRTDLGVALFHGGAMVAAYTASAPHRQVNRDALVVLVSDPTATVKVRTLYSDPAPREQGAPPPPQAISDEWQNFLSAATMAVSNRLQQHAWVVNEILEQAEPTAEGVAAALDQIAQTVHRAVRPQTMRELAEHIDALAQARFEAA